MLIFGDAKDIISTILCRTQGERLKVMTDRDAYLCSEIFDATFSVFSLQD